MRLIGRLAVIAPLIFLFRARAGAANLEPVTEKAWEAYIKSANIRMQQRLEPGMAFLWADEEPDRLTKIRAGEIAVSPIGAQNPKRVPSGLIHDWIGAVFIPGVTINDMLRVVRDYARYVELYRPTVLDSKLVATSEGKDRFSMLLSAKSYFPKTVLATDCESSYVRRSNQSEYVITRTTRIQEIRDFGTPAQQSLKEDEGMGLVWRSFSMTRYLERDGGVYFELEVIELSRDVPGALRWLIEPIVRRVSRESLSTSLRQTDDAVRFDHDTLNGLAIKASNRGRIRFADSQSIH